MFLSAFRMVMNHCLYFSGNALSLFDDHYLMLDEHLHAFAKVFEFRLKFQWPDNNQIILRIEHRGGGSVDASVPVWWN